MAACGSSRSVTATPSRPEPPSPTQAYRPTKLMSPVPCIRRDAIQALLSPSLDTWQSVQVRVSVARTVWGT